MGEKEESFCKRPDGLIAAQERGKNVLHFRVEGFARSCEAGNTRRFSNNAREFHAEVFRQEGGKMVEMTRKDCNYGGRMVRKGMEMRLMNGNK